MLVTHWIAAVAPFVGATSLGLIERQAGTRITVNTAQRYQTMDGFGCSFAFQRANNLMRLPEPQRTQVLDLIFNTSTGAGFTIVRNGVGSSPDSSRDYMNTILPRGPGSPTAEPNYVWDGKDSGQLWVSQQAVKYGVRTFYGNAWSAPGFMKTNGRDTNGGGLCGSPGSQCQSGDWRQAYANYFVKYIQLYADEGVNVTHIGFLNEPDYSTSYASMQMNGQQAADFIRILHPTLQRANLSHVQIVCCEATGYNAQRGMTQSLGSVGNMVSVISQHEYTSRISGTQPTTAKVWQTEFCDLNGGWSTGWAGGGAGDGMTWANTLHNTITTANLSAYLWWECVQDRATNNNNNEKLILVEATTYQVAKRLWAFAQYSRVVRPGAVRVGVTGGNLRTTAFVNVDGTIAVVMINQGNSDTPVTIAGIKASYGAAWVTDNQRSMVAVTSDVDGDGNVVGVTVPRQGMASILIKPVAA